MQLEHDLNTVNHIRNEIRQQMTDIGSRNVALNETLDKYRNEIAQLKFNISTLQADFETEKKKAVYYDGERHQITSKPYLPSAQDCVLSARRFFREV